MKEEGEAMRLKGRWRREGKEEERKQYAGTKGGGERRKKKEVINI